MGIIGAGQIAREHLKVIKDMDGVIAVGITSRELYDMIISLEDKKIIGTDVVELNPSFDNGSTASLAAKMISTIIAMNI